MRRARVLIPMALAVLALIALFVIARPSQAHQAHRIEEDEPGWDCRTDGNRLCGSLDVSQSTAQQLRRVFEAAKSGVAREAQESPDLSGAVAVVDVQKVVAGFVCGTPADGTATLLGGKEPLVILTSDAVFREPLVLSVPSLGAVDAPGPEARPIWSAPILIEREGPAASGARFRIHGTEGNSSPTMGNHICGPIPSTTMPTFVLQDHPGMSCWLEPNDQQPLGVEEICKPGTTGETTP